MQKKGEEFQDVRLCLTSNQIAVAARTLNATAVLYEYGIHITTEE